MEEQREVLMPDIEDSLWIKCSLGFSRSIFATFCKSLILMRTKSRLKLLRSLATLLRLIRELKNQGY